MRELGDAVEGDGFEAAAHGFDAVADVEGRAGRAWGDGDALGGGFVGEAAQEVERAVAELEERAEGGWLAEDNLCIL